LSHQSRSQGGRIPKWDLWEISRAEIVTWDEFERELSEPTYAGVLGVAELADLLNVTRQRASQIARRSDFPRPYAELASGPVWLEPMVKRFVGGWERRPGRPRTAS
jgi:hypothetical protein